MQKFDGSNIYEILPQSYKTTEMRCIAYALSNAVSRLCEYARKTQVTSNIDQLSEEILDYLALELRVQYYTQTMTREQKVNIIKSVLPWYMHSGTKSSIAGMLAAIYSESLVTEWFEYNGEPYHFKVSINNKNVFNQSDFSEFLSIIQNTKNARSILDVISVTNSVMADEVYIAHSIQQNTANTGNTDNFFIAIGGTVGDNTKLFIDGGSFTDADTDILDCGIF